MSDIVWGMIGLVVLVFLFAGEPDAFDVLHGQVMSLQAK